MWYRVSRAPCILPAGARTAHQCFLRRLVQERPTAIFSTATTATSATRPITSYCATGTFTSRDALLYVTHITVRVKFLNDNWVSQAVRPDAQPT